MAHSAIGIVNRGMEREMAVPFYDNWDACIACGSCAFICPTAAIKLTDMGCISINFPRPYGRGI
jgi:bidirectional [NiFe] hydrogenase diaphorase subunit